MLGKLRRAAVLDISDSEDSNLPGLEETHAQNKVVLDTGCTKDSIRRFRKILMTMEEAMKDDVFRGATKLELKVLYKYGIIIPVKTDHKIHQEEDKERRSKLLAGPRNVLTC